MEISITQVTWEIFFWMLSIFLSSDCMQGIYVYILSLYIYMCVYTCIYICMILHIVYNFSVLRTKTTDILWLYPTTSNLLEFQIQRCFTFLVDIHGWPVWKALFHIPSSFWLFSEAQRLCKMNEGLRPWHLLGTKNLT